MLSTTVKQRASSMSKWGVLIDRIVIVSIYVYTYKVLQKWNKKDFEYNLSFIFGNSPFPYFKLGILSIDIQ